MVKIRLRRLGARNRPFYRVVAADSRRAAKAPAIDQLGYWDPCGNPSVLRLDRAKIEQWIERGARLSPTVKKLMDRAAHEEATGGTEAATGGTEAATGGTEAATGGTEAAS